VVMEKQREPGQDSRRGFLKKLALLGASMTVLATATDVVTEGQGRADAETPGETPAKGYRLTAHIRRYYETARM
ncbi:MAG TPA: twin-arginine translocation signal domain-containing protein, partial [Syntrophobacteria bacterium]|nr:twin-arginine translocation signal domain-containing protein [Syntrophobacteria bacterium]